MLTIFSKITSSRPKVLCKKGVLRNFSKFTGKHLCLRPTDLLKKRLWHRCFPVNFTKFLRTPFSQNASGRLLLYMLMNVYEFFKFSSLESISQYGNTSWAIYLHDKCYVSAGRERNNFQQLVKTNWTKFHFHNVTSIAYS